MMPSHNELTPEFVALCGLNPAELESLILFRNESSELAADDALWAQFLLEMHADVTRLHQAGYSYRKIYQFYPHYRRAEWLDFDAPGRELWKTRLLAQVQPIIFQRARSHDATILNQSIHLLMRDQSFLNLLSGHYLRESDWVRWLKGVEGKDAMKWIKTLNRYPVLHHPEVKAMLWELAFFHVTFSTDALCVLVEELAMADSIVLQPSFFHVLFDLLQRRAITEPAIHQIRFFLTALRAAKNQAQLTHDAVKHILTIAVGSLREAKKMIVTAHAEAMNQKLSFQKNRMKLVLVKT